MFVILCLSSLVVPLCLSIDPKGDQQTVSREDRESFLSIALPLTPYYWNTNDDLIASLIDYDRFDWNLTKLVAAKSTENLLLSPLGLKLAFAVLAEGATGTTQDEISSAFNINKDRNVVRQKFSSLLSSLRADSNQYILNLGSRIYVYNNTEPRNRILAIASEFFDTEIKRTDFSNAAAAAKEINSWASSVTVKRIPNLVDAENVANNTMVVLNTVYFKGNWRYQFPLRETKVGYFYVSPKIQKKIPFMHVKNLFYVAESTKFDAKILRLPYLGNKFSMYIIVPNSMVGLPRVLEGLNGLRTELFSLQENIVDVTLPKFRFNFSNLLDGVLKEMGIKQAFEDAASFPGITRGQVLTRKLILSNVLQGLGIEVNEFGGVTYSGTDNVNEFLPGNNTHHVVADRPFLFLIQDEATRQILLIGRVSDPSSTDGVFKD